MPDIPFFWFLVIGAAALSTLVGAVGRVQARVAREAWAEAARELGFAIEVSKLRNLAINGSEGSLKISVDLHKSDDSTMTRYRIDLPPLGFDLALSRESGYHQFVKALGAEDLEIGNPDFDDRFIVKSRNPKRAVEYLTSARAAALTALAAKHPGTSFANGQLLLKTGGIEKDTDTIVSTVRDLMEAAGALLPAEGLPTSEATSEPEGEEAIGIAEPEPADRESELQRVFDTLEDFAEEETASATPDPPTPAPPVADENAALVAARLFGDQQLGFEVERRFNDEYRGASIDWTGTVQRPGRLSAGRMFEGDDHTILEINVATLEDDLYGRSSVDAVVAFPAGTALPDRGEPVRFTGHLMGVDALTKDLYVADGRVV